MNWKRRLRNTWLHPRYIGTVYLRAAVAESTSVAHGTMLDVGCGLRPYRDLFDGRIARYVGVDWPAELVTGGKPDVMADAQKLPFRSASIDTIMATELIEHLRHPEEFIEESRRLLRDGGTLILSAPFLEPLHEEPYDFRRFTSFGLRALVEDHGFSVQRICRRGGWWSVVVGSFVNQRLYDWLNPDRPGGRSTARATLLAPLLAVLQWIGFTLDRVFSGERYSLGYIVVAALSK